jgi:hypothetical protein
MTALVTDRAGPSTATVASPNTRYRVARVAGGVKIFRGALIAKNPLGFTVPAADVLGLRAFGIAQEQVDNTLGADGAAEVRYLTAVSAKFRNDTISPVTQAQLLGVVFVKDDQTVQAVSSKGVVAGIAESLERDGTVMVYVAPEITAGTEDVAAQVETVTTATALSVFAAVSLLSPTGTMAMPLPAGRYVGQRKTIRMIGGTATPIANIAGAFNTDGVATGTAQLNAAVDQLDAVWNGTAWQILNNVSVTLS